MERYRNLKEEVDGSIPGYEISSLLDKNLSGGQLPLVLRRGHVGLLSKFFGQKFVAYPWGQEGMLGLLHKSTHTY